jgi:hypothetical protein
VFIRYFVNSLRLPVGKENSSGNISPFTNEINTSARLARFGVILGGIELIQWAWCALAARVSDACYSVETAAIRRDIAACVLGFVVRLHGALVEDHSLEFLDRVCIFSAYAGYIEYNTSASGNLDFPGFDVESRHFLRHDFQEFCIH